VRAAGAKVRAHVDDKVMIENPELMERFMGGRIKLEAVKVRPLGRAGRAVRCARHGGRGAACAGALSGQCAVLFPRRPAWRSSAMRCSTAAWAGRICPAGIFATLEKSIREQIYSLPDPTVIYPGHGPETTVAREKIHNPHVLPA